VSVRNWLQLPQFRPGAAAGGGAGLGVWPEPGSGVAPANGNATADGSNSPNESSAELNDLRRDMAAIVAPFEYLQQREKVTPWSRIYRRVAWLGVNAARGTLRHSGAWRH